MTYKKIQLLCVLLYFCIASGCSDAVRLESPRLEMQEAPLGVSVPHPVFSWHLDSDRKVVEQNAYEIRVSLTLEGLDSESSLVWKFVPIPLKVPLLGARHTASPLPSVQTIGKPNGLVKTGSPTQGRTATASTLALPPATYARSLPADRRTSAALCFTSAGLARTKPI